MRRDKVHSARAAYILSLALELEEGMLSTVHSQTWEDEESKQMILRYLLGKQEMSVMTRAMLFTTLTNAVE